MIHIHHKQDCCGCSACVQRCPKQCISLYEDEEGFLYPEVDASTCIDCGLCEKVCPVLTPSAERVPLEVSAVKNPDEEIRRQSSSGGIFTLLAAAVIREGGIVFGARFDESWGVVHDCTDTVEGLSAFRGSKYAQSRVGDSFKQAEQFLRQGRQVLYSGTPCQIAGLKNYLMKEYPNLLAVDIICYGVPSPGVWQRYLHDFRIGIPADSTPVITGVTFRDKRNGWKNYSFCLRYATVDGVEEEYLQPFTATPYMQGFIEGLYLRPSCSCCPAKSGKSGSDITIADAWGIDQFAPEYDDDKGTCYVLAHTAVGCQHLHRLQLDRYPISFEHIKQYNASYFSSAHPHPRRRQFFAHYADPTIAIEHLVHETLAPTLSERVFRRIKHLLSPLKKLLHR